MARSEWERLRRRVRAMHALWQASVADLTTEQINARERDGVVPIAFSLLHFVTGEDRTVSRFLCGEPMLWETGNWGERLARDPSTLRRGAPVEVGSKASLPDADLWRAYQTEVFARTEAALAAGPESRYNDVLFPALPDDFRLSFVGMVVSEGEPVYVGEALDALVYQHGLRHLGEIDHARSLLGLTGVS